LLVGRALTSERDLAEAADNLLRQGARAVLLKGGHLAGAEVADLLMTRDGGEAWMRAPRIATANTHGTGCTLSSAIAAHMALGVPLVDAVHKARDYVRQCLQAGAAVHTGRGSGPLNHAGAPLPMTLIPL
jgi:hydroxymethylpyrimidine/phosphomethylpyrimidine kinase